MTRSGLADEHDDEMRIVEREYGSTPEPLLEVLLYLYQRRLTRTLTRQPEHGTPECRPVRTQ
jgi:hypothetical protein